MGLGTLWTLAPAPSDLLLHLVLHASCSHVFDRSLRCLNDIAETVRGLGADIDWPEVIESAHTWHAARHAYCCLSLCEDLLPAGIPPAAIDRLRVLSDFHPGEHWALLRAAGFLSLRPSARRGLPETSQEALWYLVLAPRARSGGNCRARRVSSTTIWRSRRAWRGPACLPGPLLSTRLSCIRWRSCAAA